MSTYQQQHQEYWATHSIHNGVLWAHYPQYCYPLCAVPECVTTLRQALNHYMYGEHHV